MAWPALAKHSDLYLASAVSPDTIAAIALAVGARSQDIDLAKALTTYITHVVPTAEPKTLEVLSKQGLVDMLSSAAMVHAQNDAVLALIEAALDCVNPKAADVLEEMAENLQSPQMVLQCCNDILAKLLSDEDTPFEAVLLTEALLGVWKQYGHASSAEISKSMMDIVYELSESPEYYGPLMQCGLVEMMMQAVLPDTDGSLAGKSDVSTSSTRWP